MTQGGEGDLLWGTGLDDQSVLGRCQPASQLAVLGPFTPSVLALTPNQSGLELLSALLTPACDCYDTLPPPSSVLLCHGCPSSLQLVGYSARVRRSEDHKLALFSGKALAHAGAGTGMRQCGGGGGGGGMKEGQRQFRAHVFACDPKLRVLSVPRIGFGLEIGTAADGSHPGTIASTRRCLPIGGTAVALLRSGSVDGAGSWHRGGAGYRCPVLQLDRAQAAGL